MAVYTSRFLTSVNARTAPELTGPWDSSQATLVNCRAFHPAPKDGYMCYSGSQHEFYQRDDGRTIYVTYSNTDSYQPYLHEIRLGSPITQWTDGESQAVYVAGDKAPGDTLSADGIAFYASDIPVPGFAAIHRWDSKKTGSTRYGASPPGPEADYSDMGVAFYAPLDEATAEATNTTYAPVHRWSRDGVDRYSPLNLSPAGYAAQEIAFYGACPDGDEDGLTDCAESFLGLDADLADTDGDGLGDGYEFETEGCDPVLYTDDLDGLATLEEAFLRVTNPCVWDSGYWGCANAPLRDPGCDQDTDGDRCRDAWELGPNPQFGGQRNPQDPWDYFNPTGDGRNRIDDIMAVVNKYFVDASQPGYSTAYDRGGRYGPHAWNLLPPDGLIRIDDILTALRSYMQDCA